MPSLQRRQPAQVLMRTHCVVPIRELAQHLRERSAVARNNAAQLVLESPEKVSTLSGYDIVGSGIYQIDGYRGATIKLANETSTAKVETDFHSDGVLDSEIELTGPYFYESDRPYESNCLVYPK
jgi:hypothetical protein